MVSENIKKQLKNNNSNHNELIVNNSLNSIIKGAVLIFIATLFGIIFSFLTRILIARSFSPEQYGIFNLFITIILIFSSIGAFGIQNGISRYIAYYSGKKLKYKVGQIINNGLIIGMVCGLIAGFLLFIFSNDIASTFSNNVNFVNYVKLAAFIVPLYVIIELLISVFRGFQKVKEKVIFFDFLRNLFFFLFMLIIITQQFSFGSIFFSYFLSIVIISFLFLFYFNKRENEFLFKVKKSFLNVRVGKKLLLFSFPLLIVAILHEFMGWTDTLMIAFFTSDELVGFYNGAKPLSGFVSMGLMATSFIYAPLIANLYGRKKFEEIRNIYFSITKWICILALPITLVLIIFPDIILAETFGSEYKIAAFTLQILTIAFFLDTFLGLNAGTLTAFGKTKFLMFSSSIAAVINILLNAILIPIYGLVGAGIATAISIFIVNIFRSIKLFRMENIHTFKLNIIKPILLTTFLISLTGLLIRNMFKISLLELFLFGIFSIIVFIISVIITKSITKEDINLLISIENILNIEFKLIKKILNRFI